MRINTKILLALTDNRPTIIARELEITRQAVDYHARRFVRLGLLEKQTHYRLTTLGKESVKPVILTTTMNQV